MSWTTFPLSFMIFIISLFLVVLFDLPICLFFSFSLVSFLIYLSISFLISFSFPHFSLSNELLIRHYIPPTLLAFLFYTRPTLYCFFGVFLFRALRTYPLITYSISLEPPDAVSHWPLDFLNAARIPLSLGLERSPLWS